MLNSRSVSVDLDRVDAVLGEAAALQEGTVVADLHTLTREVTGLEQLDAVVLAVLTEGQKVGRQTEHRGQTLHYSSDILPLSRASVLLDIQKTSCVSQLNSAKNSFYQTLR